MDNLDTSLHTYLTANPISPTTVTAALIRAHAAYAHEILLLHPASAFLNNWDLVTLDLARYNHTHGTNTTGRPTVLEAIDALVKNATGLRITQIIGVLEHAPSPSAKSRAGTNASSPAPTVMPTSSNGNGNGDTDDHANGLRKSSAPSAPTPPQSQPMQLHTYILAVDQDHTVKLNPAHHSDHIWAKAAETTALELDKDVKARVVQALELVARVDRDCREGGIDGDGDGEEGEVEQGRGRRRGRTREREVPLERI